MSIHPNFTTFCITADSKPKHQHTVATAATQSRTLMHDNCKGRKREWGGVWMQVRDVTWKQVIIVYNDEGQWGGDSHLTQEMSASVNLLKNIQPMELETAFTLTVTVHKASSLQCSYSSRINQTITQSYIRLQAQLTSFCLVSVLLSICMLSLSLSLPPWGSIGLLELK